MTKIPHLLSALLLMLITTPLYAQYQMPIGLIQGADSLNYAIFEDSTACIFDCFGASGDVVVPSKVTHEGTVYHVTQVYHSCFSDNTKITSVTLPPTIRRIYNYAFMGCTNLKTIQGGANPLEYVGERPFYGNLWLEDQFAKAQQNSLISYNGWILGHTIKGDAVLDEFHIKEGLVGMARQSGSIPARIVYLPSTFLEIPDEMSHDEDLVTEKFIVDSRNPMLFSDERGAVYFRNLSYSIYPTIHTDTGYVEKEFQVSGQILYHIPSANKSDSLHIAPGTKILESDACEYLNFKYAKIPEGVEYDLSAFQRNRKCTTYDYPTTLKLIEMSILYPARDINIIFRSTTPPFSHRNTFEHAWNINAYVPRESIEAYKKFFSLHEGIRNRVCVRAIEDGILPPRHRADVNNDGVINSADVVAIYNYVITGNAGEIHDYDLDINNDDEINTADVIDIYNSTFGEN